MEVKVTMPGREELTLVLELSDAKEIKTARLQGVGGPDLLELISEYRPRLQGALMDLEPPEGNSTAAILLRELILKAQGQWSYPYEEDELCHCRAVPTQNVDMAIVTGAHTPEKVTRLTSASTSCGTCRPNVEEIIQYRLKPKG